MTLIEEKTNFKISGFDSKNQNSARVKVSHVAKQATMNRVTGFFMPKFEYFEIQTSNIKLSVGDLNSSA